MLLSPVALAAVAAALVLPLPSHASIVGTTPEDGATITSAPEAFSVTANEDILTIDGATANVLLLSDEEGRYYGDGCTTIDGATMSADAELGEAGLYTMRYQLVSADGHPIEGVTTFAWQPETSTGVEGQAEAPTCGAAAPSEEPSASPTDEASASPSATATDEPSESEAPSASPSGEAAPGDDEDGGSPLLFIGGGIAALAGVAVILWLTWRRSRGMRADQAGEPTDPDAQP